MFFLQTTQYGNEQFCEELHQTHYVNFILNSSLEPEAVTTCSDENISTECDSGYTLNICLRIGEHKYVCVDGLFPCGRMHEPITERGHKMYCVRTHAPRERQ